MNKTVVTENLLPLAASQWGMVTTAQAEQLGVSRSVLSQMERFGKLERLAQGVYRHAAAPSDRFEQLHAAWLSLYPKKTAEERLKKQPFDSVVSLETAAWLLGVGDLVPEPYRFSTFARKQTQRSDITLRTRRYAAQSVAIKEGLPVTTLEQTIADLVENNTDLSLVSGIFLNCSRDTLHALDKPHLAKLLAPYAQRNSLQANDGQRMLDMLMPR
jgi:predicted transcriptional regulator of viral defense system